MAPARPFRHGPPEQSTHRPFGELASTEAAQRKLRQPVFLAQLDLAKVYDLPLKKITAHDLSRFQAVERDFSFVFPDTIQWHTIASAIHALAIPELQSFKPVEVWRNVKYPGVYSLLLRNIFQSHDRTLRDEELTQWSTRIIDTLTGLGGVIRAPAALTRPDPNPRCTRTQIDSTPVFRRWNPRPRRLYSENMSSSTISIDEFQALEQKVLRAVEIVKREREARATAEAEAASLREQLAAYQSNFRAVESEITTLNKERDAVRLRVEKMLQQMDELL